jgi:release factor glutamine methyltransferase
MTLKEALHATAARLEQAGIPDARLDAEYLVAEAVGLPRLRLGIVAKSEMPGDAHARLRRWTEERLQRRPLAYVLGEQPFLNLTLRVNPSVLVPRPETELLVEEALRILNFKHDAIAVDVGTGSGNIALSLAQHRHVAEVHAIDISPAALHVAQENALRNTISSRVHWHEGDLLAPLIEKDIHADMIVANLPYVRTGEMHTLPPEVRWEPGLALDGGADGLAYIYPLVAQAEKVLMPEGCLLLEIGADQQFDVMNHLRANHSWEDVVLYHDLAGLPRIVYAQKGALVGSAHH